MIKLLTIFSKVHKRIQNLHQNHTCLFLSV